MGAGGPVCRPYGGDVASPGGASGRPRPTKGGGGKPPPYGFPETVLKLGRGALVLPPETCAREPAGG